jgi:hypothetical protein
MKDVTLPDEKPNPPILSLSIFLKQHQIKLQADYRGEEQRRRTGKTFVLAAEAVVPASPSITFGPKIILRKLQ